MSDACFRLALCLPAQGASEIEATLLEWHVAAGDRFEKGAVLAQAEGAKSVFDFIAPCAGAVVRLCHLQGETVPLNEPVLEIETGDPAMRDLPPAEAAEDGMLDAAPIVAPRQRDGDEVVILGVGGYLPQRVVSNGELIGNFPGVTEDYVYQVTGIRERRWAAEGEKPSEMALAASREAIRKSGLTPADIDTVLVATTTPDVAMPSTACILKDKLGLPAGPALDLNAACSGWLYAVALARSMILSGMARNVLAVGVDLQSRLLNGEDRNAFFIFGDGAGAAVISSGTMGHRICQAILDADTRGLHMARREMPGYLTSANGTGDPWVRLDGQALFRFATESFTALIHRTIASAGWKPEETRWIIPHQANARILKAAARHAHVPFERFYLNMQRVGNTSSASIPLALVEAEAGFNPGDKLILCAVGAGMTTAAIAVEW